MSGIVARLQEFATTRSLDLSGVTMPAWRGAAETAAEQDVARDLGEHLLRLKEERVQLLSQVEKVREQRRRFQEVHLGTGVPVEEPLPLLSTSPTTKGGESVGMDGEAQSSTKMCTSVACHVAPAPEPKKPTCCAIG